MQAHLLPLLHTDQEYDKNNSMVAGQPHHESFESLPDEAKAILEKLDEALEDDPIKDQLVYTLIKIMRELTEQPEDR